MNFIFGFLDHSQKKHTAKKFTGIVDHLKSDSSVVNVWDNITIRPLQNVVESLKLLFENIVIPFAEQMNKKQKKPSKVIFPFNGSTQSVQYMFLCSDR